METILAIALSICPININPTVIHSSDTKIVSTGIYSYNYDIVVVNFNHHRWRVILAHELGHACYIKYKHDYSEKSAIRFANKVMRIYAGKNKK